DGKARDRRRRAHRPHQGGRVAVAVWAEGIEVFEQAVLTAGRAGNSNTTPRSRGTKRPSLARSFALPSQNRRRREDRVRAAPAVSCAICTQRNAHEHTGSAE